MANETWNHKKKSPLKADRKHIFWVSDIIRLKTKTFQSYRGAKTKRSSTAELLFRHCRFELWSNTLLRLYLSLDNEYVQLLYMLSKCVMGSVVSRGNVLLHGLLSNGANLGYS